MFKLLLPAIFIVQFSSAQSIIRGKILSQSDKRPIAYVNIGIINTAVGTISNEDGSFSLQVPNHYTTDSLLFSAIGFGRKNVLIQSLVTDGLTIFLQEQITQLNEVTIASTREKNKRFELGNKNYNGGVLETDTTYAGASKALLIENKSPLYGDLAFPIYLEAARIRIYRNNLASFKFRIRIYSVDSLTHQPGEDLLDKSIVMESTIKNGWLEFDLSSYKFIVTGPFFIAFERILTSSDRVAIAIGYQEFKKNNPNDLKIDTVLYEGNKVVQEVFKRGGMDLPGTFIGISTHESVKQHHLCFTRKTSFDSWEKVRGILSATVILTNRIE
jgi:CarboxypepD_reg-like domain